MNETEILCNENDLNLQSWCKRPLGSKKSNRILMFILIQKCSHLSIVFGSSRPVGSCLIENLPYLFGFDFFFKSKCIFFLPCLLYFSFSPFAVYIRFLLFLLQYASGFPSSTSSFNSSFIYV